MREVDRVAVEETGPSLLQMMEHAGLELALASLAMLGEGWPSARGSRAPSPASVRYR